MVLSKDREEHKMEAAQGGNPGNKPHELKEPKEGQWEWKAGRACPRPGRLRRCAALGLRRESSGLH